MQPIKNCLHCLAPIIGRHDKKFCSEACRSIANYEKRRTARLPTQKINNILWKNREILRALWDNRPTTVSRDELLSHGFHFTYHTHLRKTSGGTYYACYDFGFLPRLINGEKSALIVKMLKFTQQDPWNHLYPPNERHSNGSRSNGLLSD